MRAAAAAQRQRLLLEHRLDGLAGGLRIKPVLRDEICAVGRDCIDVLSFLSRLK